MKYILAVAVPFTFLYFLPFQVAHATITWSGSIDPLNPDPASWTSSTVGYIGKTGDGTITVNALGSGRELRTGTGYIGYGVSSDSTVTVNGFGYALVTWSNSNSLYVGHSGDGKLDIKGRGRALSDYAYLGYNSSSSGDVTVDGNQSLFDSERLYVGYTGSGSIGISHSGDVDSSFAYIGRNAGATGVVSVDGVGSRIRTGSELHVGYEGSGSIWVTNGGETQGGQVSYIGYEADSDGDVTIEGEQSLGHFTNLYVGYSGNGSIGISDNGNVDSYRTWLGHNQSSTGTVTIDGNGSQWKNSSNFYIGWNASGVNGRGTVTISDGGLLSIGGSLTIDPVFDLDSSINLATGGMLALPHEVDASITEFLSVVGGTDDVRYWNESLADWDLLTNATNGVDYTLDYMTNGDLAGFTVLSVGASPGHLGDYNGDGVVDAADYTVWRDNLGQSDSSLNGNGTGDPSGNVVQADYDLWRVHYGEVYSSLSSEITTNAAALPEPSGAMIVLTLVCFGLVSERRSGIGAVGSV